MGEAFPSNNDMKAILKIAVLTFLVIGMSSGCSSEPAPTGYVTPTHFISQIASADHIVVTNCLAGHQRAPKWASFSMTITGRDAKKIIHAISTLREPTYGVGGPMSATFYEWQLQFYRGTELLGTADLSWDLVLCDGEYHEPWALRRLYHHIVKESREYD